MCARMCMMCMHVFICWCVPRQINACVCGCSYTCVNVFTCVRGHEHESIKWQQSNTQAIVYDVKKTTSINMTRWQDTLHEEPRHNSAMPKTHTGLHNSAHVWFKMLKTQSSSQITQRLLIFIIFFIVFFISLPFGHFFHPPHLFSFTLCHFSPFFSSFTFYFRSFFSSLCGERVCTLPWHTVMYNATHARNNSFSTTSAAKSTHFQPSFKSSFKPHLTLTSHLKLKKKIYHHTSPVRIPHKITTSIAIIIRREHTNTDGTNDKQKK